jgi:hypothetical protein
MKKIYFVFLLGIINLTAIAQTAFTTGNLAVLRIGNGNTISGAATAGAIQEFTTTGTLVQSFYLDSTTSPITFAGSASSEGQLSRSVDKSALVVAGYGTVPGTATPNTATAATINRVVAVITKDAAVDLTTRLTDAYNGSNIRGATATDATNIYTSGNGGSGQGATAGVRYTTKGSTTTTQISATISNTRFVSIYNNQLYVTSGSGLFHGVSSIGTGVPTTTGETATILPGFSTTSGPSAYAFDINSTGTIMYVADDRTSAAGGVQKWELISGTWTYAYSLRDGLVSGSTPAQAGARGVVVDWTTTPNPTIYATSSGTSQNTLASVVDAGAASTFTILATAPSGTGFRGLAYVPELGTNPVTLNNFNVQKSNSSVQITWKTEQETNSSHFIIQRSADGVTWSDIATVSASGNSNTIKDYTTNDISPLSGLNFYRLKQFDIEGNFKYSPVKKVLFSNQYKVMISPNPVKDFINLYVSKVDNESVKVSVIDASGRIVRSTVSNLSLIQISTQGLRKGMYVVKIIDANNVSSEKIMIQ